MSSAQLDIQPLDEAAEPTEAAAAPFVLKQQVAERLAAHRARNGNPQTSAAPSAPAPRSSSAKPRAARIAATVAERYAQSQSYRAYLAAEAERAIRQAEAAAEVAARNAQAIADAQNQLLAELEQWELTPPVSEPMSEVESEVESSPLPPAQVSSAGLTVRLYEEIAAPEPFGRALHPNYEPEQYPLDEEERLALEDEIAFRQSPTFEDPVAPVEIPANLIEFPRQLVASRRARPRLAEGPLREEASQAPDPAQLRIFEVEPAQISSDPVAESVAPEWSSIMLGALPAAVQHEVPQVPFSPAIPVHTASMNLRLMAAIVDGCIVAAGVILFAAAFVSTLNKLPGMHGMGDLPPQAVAVAATGVFLVLALVYQALFFTFSDATPGMRYARIALCTFNDENPTRAAMRRRIFAAVLSACPLGIGFLWAWLDDDGLGWHDRISRMYQRSY